MSRIGIIVFFFYIVLCGSVSLAWTTRNRAPRAFGPRETQNTKQSQGSSGKDGTTLCGVLNLRGNAIALATCGNTAKRPLLSDESRTLKSRL